MTSAGSVLFKPFSDLPLAAQRSTAVTQLHICTTPNCSFLYSSASTAGLRLGAQHPLGPGSAGPAVSHRTGIKDPAPNCPRVPPGTFSCLGLPVCVPTWAPSAWRRGSQLSCLCRSSRRLAGPGGDTAPGEDTREEGRGSAEAPQGHPTHRSRRPHGEEASRSLASRVGWASPGWPGARFSLLESERSPARFLGNQETRRQGGGGLRMAVPASHSSPFQ